ncbi:acyl-CoA dehydrogenase family protein [Streptomyces sp. URMC 127]|uniref:acyl-CoA dehydrogenase family protein n=1 Tax=Streptomyces sp. URMC 127 TaxID=3423402 RepID=UPI003F1985CD
MPTQTELLSAAAKAARVAGEGAVEADAGRRLRPEVVDALADAGFSRAFVPAESGGAPVSFTEVTRAVAAVAEECPSAAWVGSLMAHTGRFAGFLPAEGRADVWADGPGTRLVAGLVSQVVAEPVDGGWELSGTWSFVSGVEFSEWALLMATTDAGEARFFAVPRADYTFEDTWFTLGMRATGSHALTVERAFVPAHRSFPFADLMAGNQASDEPVYAAPWLAVNSLTFAAPILGAARAALAVVSASLSSAKPPKDSVRVDIARSAGEIDAAELLLLRAAATADRGGVTAEETARGSRDCALAVEILSGAVDRLFRGAGTRAQAEGSPLQRIWRDVRGAASHGGLQFESAALRWAAPRPAGA